MKVIDEPNNVQAILAACGGSIDKIYFAGVSVGDQILVNELRNYDRLKDDNRVVSQRKKNRM